MKGYGLRIHTIFRLPDRGIALLILKWGGVYCVQWARYKATISAASEMWTKKKQIFYDEYLSAIMDASGLLYAEK